MSANTHAPSDLHAEIWRPNAATIEDERPEDAGHNRDIEVPRQRQLRGIQLLIIGPSLFLGGGEGVALSVIMDAPWGTVVFSHVVVAGLVSLLVGAGAYSRNKRIIKRRMQTR
jgi:hypothetical protein